MPSRPLPGSTGGSARNPAPFQSAPGSTGGSARNPAPFQSAPGSTGGSARNPAPFQSAPGSTGGSPRTPAAFQPAPGSTGETPRIPAALSAQAVPRGARKIPILVDWWLEKVKGEESKISVAGTTFTPQMMSPLMRKGASSSKGNRNLARRVFRSSAIVKRHDYTTIESEDGYHIRLGGLLNAPKSRESGFSEEVCECFEFGFQDRWQEVVNPKMVPDNEHAQSPSETTTSAPSPSVEDYMAEFLSDSFSSSIRFGVTENNFDSFVGYSGNTGGLSTQSLWNLPDDNAGNMMHVPEKPLAPPGEACNSGQETYQHESTQIDASKQEIVNRSISSISVKQSTGSISFNSKVDGNILAPSKILSVVNDGCSCIVGCEAEEDDIPRENMHSCSSEHGMVTLPIDCMSSQLGEPGIPKSGKDSVNLGTSDALELPTEGMTPNFGAIGCSEESTGRRLRSGKVLGMPSGGPMKSGHKKKKIQLDASSKQMINQGATSTADLTSHENSFSAAEAVVEEKLESHDSCRKGRGRPKGKRNRKRKQESARLFWNWV